MNSLQIQLLFSPWAAQAFILDQEHLPKIVQQPGWTSWHRNGGAWLEEPEPGLFVAGSTPWR